MYVIKRFLIVLFFFLFFASCISKNSKKSLILNNKLGFDISVPEISSLTETDNFNLLTININLQEQKKYMDQKYNSMTISEFGNPEIFYHKVKNNSEIVLDLDLQKINRNKPLALYYFIQNSDYRILYDGYVNVMINDGWITLCDEYMTKNNWDITLENSFKITKLAVSDFSSYERLIIKNGEKYKMNKFEDILDKYRNMINTENIFNDETFIQNLHSR